MYACFEFVCGGTTIYNKTQMGIDVTQALINSAKMSPRFSSGCEKVFTKNKRPPAGSNRSTH